MAFNIASLRRSETKPPRIIIHGEPGIGKSTFGACAPDPVFLLTEDGLGNLDVPHFPLARSFDDVLEAITSLYTDEHQFKTLVVDSIDWLEPLIWSHTCSIEGVDSVEKIGGGYGKGYVETAKYWRQFLDAITALRDDKGMIIVMIAHSQKVRVEDPMTAAYDTMDLKMHKRASALCEEFADVILYACLHTAVVQEDAGFNKKRSRAVSNGSRVMHTIGTPAYLAKNRYSLPTPLPLSWESFSEAMKK